MAEPDVAIIEITDEFAPARGLQGVDSDGTRAHASAVSWGAILAGAAAAAALSLILLILGAGLGLSSVSPWIYDGISATTFGVSTILDVVKKTAAANGVHSAGYYVMSDSPADAIVKAARKCKCELMCATTPGAPSPWVSRRA
jgi:hypothetical protein